MSRHDLVASELLVELEEMFPLYNSNRLLAELKIEDALKAAALEERERCLSLIQTRVAWLLRQTASYSRNAATQLQEVQEELEADQPPTNLVPQEEELDVVFPRRQW